MLGGGPGGRGCGRVRGVTYSGTWSFRYLDVGSKEGLYVNNHLVLKCFIESYGLCNHAKAEAKLVSCMAHSDDMCVSLVFMLQLLPRVIFNIFFTNTY